MGTRFAGIEAEIRPDGAVFHLVILQRKGGKLSVERLPEETKSIDELPLNLLKDIPASIVITGKGILYRNVEADPDAGPEILLRKILPNVNAGEFFISSRNNGSTHFVSLARKNALLPLLSELKQRCSVVSFDVGLHCTGDIQSLLPAVNVVQCGHHVVTFEKDTISSVEYTTDTTPTDPGNVFFIGGEEVPSVALTAFAAGLRIAAGNLLSLQPGMHTEFIQRRLFRSTLRSSVIFIFVLLLVNYFVFSHYWSRQQELETESGSEVNAMTEVNLLREQVEARTDFLQNAGLLDNSSFAWYADQLAHHMPEGIRLSQMNFSPRLNVAEEDTIGFRKSTIEISGNCEESITLNRWIQFLQEEEWISSASIRSYEQGKADATGKFSLNLELH